MSVSSLRGEGLVGVDEDLAVLDRDRVDGDRLVGREVLRLAGRELELRAVRPALQAVVLESPTAHREAETAKAHRG